MVISTLHTVTSKTVTMLYCYDFFYAHPNTIVVYHYNFLYEDSTRCYLSIDI